MFARALFKGKTAACEWVWRIIRIELLHFAIELHAERWERSGCGTCGYSDYPKREERGSEECEGVVPDWGRMGDVVEVEMARRGSIWHKSGYYSC